MTLSSQDPKKAIWLCHRLTPTSSRVPAFGDTCHKPMWQKCMWASTLRRWPLRSTPGPRVALEHGLLHVHSCFKRKGLFNSFSVMFQPPAERPRPANGRHPRCVHPVSAAFHVRLVVLGSVASPLLSHRCCFLTGQSGARAPPASPMHRAVPTCSSRADARGAVLSLHSASHGHCGHFCCSPPLTSHVSVLHPFT